jgi:predicted metal-dependent hydrolase
MAQIELGGKPVEVIQKNIKNIHLSVYPPHGHVRIAAPMRMDLDTIRVYAISKLAWIKSQQQKITAQDRETPREYLERESHYVWGKRYVLTLLERDGAPKIELGRNKITLQLRPQTEIARRHDFLDAWYRDQVKAAVPALIEKWEAVIGVKAGQIYVQRMKTKWGSCNAVARSIRLNTDLAKKPPECLEYIVVHELVHLLEPTHNARFYSLVERFMPNWQHCKDALNRLPVRHEDWAY